MEQDLNREIFGQEHAISSIVSAIKRNKIGISCGNRPVGNFLFVGSTGVGKTELCKTLAKTFYGSEKNMLKLDMSEYMEANSVSKLIGAPPGYVGYDKYNPITNKIKRNPYIVLVFDEIEKAHPDVFNLLLQILDEGTLTDSHYKKINFKNCIIILTSNVNFKQLKNIGFQKDCNNVSNYKNIIEELLKKKFRPEFLSRIDEIIIFENLSHGVLKKIISNQLEKLKTRLKNINYNFIFSSSVVDYILNMVKNETQGARKIKNIITKEIENFISNKILNKKIKKHKKYSIKVSKKKLCIKAM